MFFYSGLFLNELLAVLDYDTLVILVHAYAGQVVDGSVGVELVLQRNSLLDAVSLLYEVDSGDDERGSLAGLESALLHVGHVVALEETLKRSDAGIAPSGSIGAADENLSVDSGRLSKLEHNLLIARPVGRLGLTFKPCGQATPRNGVVGDGTVLVVGQRLVLVPSIGEAVDEALFLALGLRFNAAAVVEDGDLGHSDVAVAIEQEGTAPALRSEGSGKHILGKSELNISLVGEVADNRLSCGAVLIVERNLREAEVHGSPVALEKLHLPVGGGSRHIDADQITCLGIGGLELSTTVAQDVRLVGPTGNGSGAFPKRGLVCHLYHLHRQRGLQHCPQRL